MPTLLIDVWVRNCVRIQPISNEELVLASEAMEVMRRWYELSRGGGFLVSTSQVNGCVLRLRKLFITH
jgi:hypothetical protein